MSVLIGLRAEDKNLWERRVPIIPIHASELQRNWDIKFVVENSSQRIFTSSEYKEKGIEVSDSLDRAQIIFGVKEIPKEKLHKNKVYVFFSHVIKGQEYNMPMLSELLKKGCTLIDYERIVNQNNQRLIFFGRFAGIAGMIDTLWGLGERLKKKGMQTPFTNIRQAIKYSDLDEAKNIIKEVGEAIRTDGLPKSLSPLIIGLTGYGNVSKGAQEILEILPFEEIKPEELSDAFDNVDNRKIYKVIFQEENLVEPLEGDFTLQDYYQSPQKYRGIFEEKYLKYLTVLVNSSYWAEQYPRHISRQGIKQLYSQNELRLEFVGDLSIDIEGGIEISTQATTPDKPIFIYDPVSQKTSWDLSLPGIPVLAVDILPTELPKDASVEFSKVLKQFVPQIAQASYDVPFKNLSLSPEIKKAVIVYKGKLTPDYQYLSKYI